MRRSAEFAEIPAIGRTALSLGERVASEVSQVRGCFVALADLVSLGRTSHPSPVPRPLVKAPVAGHPLPKGEGKTQFCGRTLELRLL